MAYALAARLERAVKNAGVKYKKVSGWASRGHGAMGAVRGIVPHHTAGPASGNSPSLRVVAYGRPGLSGPLAQLFLARDGTVYLVAAGVAYHAGRVNNSNFANIHSIGIEAEATCWETSRHILHFREHPAEYEAAVDSFIKKMDITKAHRRD